MYSSILIGEHAASLAKLRTQPESLLQLQYLRYYAMQCKHANPNAWCSGSARLGLFRSLLSQVPLADGATLDSITREARVDVPRALQVPYRT